VKKYARSMVKDLAIDSLELTYAIRNGHYALTALDSFFKLVGQTDFRQVPTGKLYWYGLWGGYLRGFQSSDATFQQMKNSGSLRYFNNESLEGKLAEYDQLMRALQTLTSIEQSIYLETRKARSRIFDFRHNLKANKVVAESVYRVYNQAAIDSIIATNPPLLSTDPLVFNEYAELCRSRNLRSVQNNMERALGLARDIISTLVREYHISDPEKGEQH
jgi:hypothetical protein